jgi:hypothetical protein
LHAFLICWWPRQPLVLFGELVQAPLAIISDSYRLCDESQLGFLTLFVSMYGAVDLMMMTTGTLVM